MRERSALLAGLAYISAALATLALATLAFDQTVALSAVLGAPPLWAGLLVAVAFGVAARAEDLWAEFVPTCWLLLGLVSLANVMLNVAPLHRYGDGPYVLNLIRHGEISAKWLLGTRVLGGIYSVIPLPPLVHMPYAEDAGPATLVSAIGVLLTSLSAAALLWRWQGRLTLLLPTLTPVWILFAAGHLEYYPLVAWAPLVALAWLLDRPLGERAAWQVGLLAAVLPLLYIGFAPLEALLLGCYLLAAPRRAVPAGLIAATGFVILVWLCWPGGIADFWPSLRGQLNLGETNIGFQRYHGQSAGPDTIFLRTSYAISGEHLRDVAYMYFWGGGVWAPLLLIVGSTLALRGLRGRLLQLLREPRFWLAVGVLGWQIFYILFMIPKLGPVFDVDLFFCSYIVVAFCAGLVLDAALPTVRHRALIASAALGSSSISAIFLLWLGLPLRE